LTHLLQPHYKGNKVQKLNSIKKAHNLMLKKPTIRGF